MGSLRIGRGRIVVFLAATGMIALTSWCGASDREFGNQVPAIAEQIAKSGKQRIAVVDFTDLQGDVTELGRFLAEELSVSLAAAAKGFDVIDRTHLENLLTEHRLSARGLIDPQTTQKLKVAGVQGLLTGTVIPLGDTVRLTLKVLDVETAKISAPTEVDIPKTPAIQALIERGIDRGQEASTPTGSTGSAVVRQRQVVQNMAFDLKGCRLTGGRAVCTFSVTSVEADASFAICSSRIMDEEGSEFGVDDIWMGGSKRSGASLVAAVPISLRLLFPLPERANRLALLEFEFSQACSYNSPHKVQFGAIPLSR